LGGKKVVPAGDGARAFTKPFDAQDLAPNRTDELFGCSITGAAKQAA
jgi:hypothetical protein